MNNVVNIINFAKPETGGFLVDIILWLVTATGSVVVGIILFTLALKLITLPFDFISRSSMRKNSIIMEEMRPELEKLQKQYADNKDLYNQKMMALYKKNGYSMMSSCLPTILTLVIFIVAINAFTNYSKFQNRQYFYDMSVAYNSVYYDGFSTDDEYIVKNEDGTITIYDERISSYSTENEYIIPIADGKDIIVSKLDDKLTVSTEGGYIEYSKPISTDWKGAIELKIINSEYTPEYLIDLARQRSAESYRANEMSFLWVKNVWVTDSPLSHPIEADWEKFKSTHGYESGTNDTMNADTYKELIHNLEDEKGQANGYFILVVLTAGISLLTQLVTKKTQKAQMELQTVDGQGAQTQKIMTYLMPIMMAVFAFMYTAAFSIYIILSSALGLGQTFLINFIIDKKFSKKKTKSEKTVIRGRVYTPKEKPSEQKKPAKKEKVRKVPESGDFLAGTADKHIRKKN